MKFFLYIPLLISIFSCKQKIIKNSSSTKVVAVKTKAVDSIVLDSILCGLNFKAGKNYTSEKQYIENQRRKLAVLYKNSAKTKQHKILDSANTLFTKLLLNKIIPYWYGTPWDFNGYTAIPNQGEIACGYFVSTTLKDMGLNLNRYKLAQQAAKDEIEAIAINKNNILHYTDNTIQDKLTSLKNGLYFVGLDNHVGYVYITAKETYFIHSNYIENRVMIEKSKYSEAFNSSNYYLAKISYNKELMKKWLDKTPIRIKKN